MALNGILFVLRTGMSLATSFDNESDPEMSPIYLIEGPVGAGKSTFAKSLATQLQGTHIALDEWLSKLFSPDRPDEDVIAWYLQCKDRLLDVIWSHAVGMSNANQVPILELGFQRQARYDLYAKAHEIGTPLKLYVLDAPVEVRRRRVRQRNEQRGSTFSMVVPDHIFEIASNMWEAPDQTEIADFDAKVLTTENQG